MSLSDKDIKDLLEKAESHWDNNEFDKTLECYDQIIENAPVHHFYFRERARVYQAKGKPSLAIADMNKAIELAPDNAEYYETRGKYFLAHLYDAVDFLFHTSENKSPHASERPRAEKILTARAKRVLSDFKASIEKDPARAGVWLYLLELNIFLCNFDEAISMYGSCRLYIIIKEDNLIRAWLGCLALIFAGDILTEEDKKPLYDLTIKLEAYHLARLSRVTNFIAGLRRQDNYREKCKKAIEIQGLLLNHLKELGTQGQELLKLECYEEALDVYNKVLESGSSDNYSAMENKIDILGRLKRYEGILKCINSSRSPLINTMIAEKAAGIFGALDSDEKTLNLLEKLTELSPDISLGWYNKGLWFKHFARYEEAFKAFDKAIELSPRDVRAWFSRSCLFALKGDKTNAFKDLSEAIKLHYMTKEFAKKDNDFRVFWDDPDFKALTG